MKVIGLLIVSLLFLSASAQEPARCGTDLIIEKQLQVEQQVQEGEIILC